METTGELSCQGGSLNKPPREDWVMCDKCMTWRLLSPGFDITMLPEEWFCYMKPFSGRCEMPEQKVESGIITVTPKRSGYDMKENSVVEASLLEKASCSAEVKSDESCQNDLREWVQCDNCEKWRLLSRGFDFSMLPDKWFCYMKPFNGICEMPEENVERQVKTGSSNRSGYDVAENLDMEASSCTSEGKSDESCQNDLREWLQCDKCEKWRLLSRGFDVSMLPDKWFCYMKPFNGKCEMPEENVERQVNTGSSNRSGYDIAENLDMEASCTSEGKSDESCQSDLREWLQCDKCEKWRLLSRGYDISMLPDKWFCSMMPFNGKCEMPEQNVERRVIAVSSNRSGNDMGEN